MDRSKMRKSQGCISSNAEASEKLQALFSQESDTSLVSSVADCSADEKREATADSSTSATDSNFNNTCVEVNSLPRIVITPPPANVKGTEKQAEKKGVTSGTKEHFPSIKIPLCPAERIRSASLGRNQARSDVKRKPLKLPLLKPDRISSASVRRKQQLIRSCPSPIEEEEEEELANRTTGDTSVPAAINRKEESDNEPRSAEQPSPSSSNTEQYQSEVGEEVKGVQCPTPSTTYDDLYSDDFDTYTDSDTDDDVIQTNECTSKQPISARQLSGGKKPRLPYVLPRQQRRSRFHVFDAAKISPLMKNKSLQTTKKFPAAVSADLQQKSLLPQRRKKEPNCIKTPMEKRTSRLPFTTQKKKANETNTILCDVNRTEISPIINRFQDEDDHDGLISFQFKPKLSIPRRRYFSRRHSLTQCTDKDDHLPGNTNNRDFDVKPPEEPVAIKRVSKRTTKAQQQEKIANPTAEENAHSKMSTNNLGLSKPVKKPPLQKSSIYVENYRKKASRFCKNQVLPPIASKPTEDKQPTLALKPTPPQSQPASGQAASLRLMRREGIKSKQKNKTSRFGKKE